MTDDREARLENYRLNLRKLLVGWRTASQDFQVPSDRTAVAHIVMPWTTQVHRFGRAFLRLEMDGLEHEGHPLVRSAFEYAVVSHWAAHVGDNAVLARYGKDQAKLRALVSELNGGPDDVVPPQWRADMFSGAIDDQPVADVDEKQFIDNFQHICRDLGLPGTLYPIYRVLCWITHPTTQAARVYLPEPQRLTSEPSFSRPMGLVSLMTHAVYWTRRTADDLMVNHPYSDWLDELAQSINVVRRLPAPKSVRLAEMDRSPGG